MRVSLHRDGESADYMADMVAASPGYFQALGMRLLAGRWFTTADDAQHPPVMIMTTNTDRRFFDQGNPIGQTLVLPTMRDGVRGSARVALVGVVANVRTRFISGLGLPGLGRTVPRAGWRNLVSNHVRLTLGRRFGCLRQTGCRSQGGRVALRSSPSARRPRIFVGTA
jgi:hypothetical protein